MAGKMWRGRRGRQARLVAASTAGAMRRGTGLTRPSALDAVRAQVAGSSPTRRSAPRCGCRCADVKRVRAGRAAGAGIRWHAGKSAADRRRGSATSGSARPGPGGRGSTAPRCLEPVVTEAAGRAGAMSAMRRGGDGGTRWVLDDGRPETDGDCGWPPSDDGGGLHAQAAGPGFIDAALMRAAPSSEYVPAGSHKVLPTRAEIGCASALCRSRFLSDSAVVECAACRVALRARQRLP